MSRPDLSRERIDYDAGTLTEEQAGTDPHALFDQWLADAIARRDDQGDLAEPNAMVLATADAATLQPHARTVLLKEHEDGRFVFFTNYDSAKGREIASNARVSLSFTWVALQRQVRIEGVAEKLPAEASDAYHRIRPRGAQIGAWASPQSEPVADRDELRARHRAMEEKFEGEDVPRPPHWGGYAVIPSRIEFWQGGGDRLHDRIVFTRGASGTSDTAGESPAASDPAGVSPIAGGEWSTERLAP